MIKKHSLIFGILILFLSPSIAIADVSVIYDNISTAQFKTVKISSDLCINGVTNCKHEIYINGSFYTYFQDGELLQLQDGSDVVIVLDDPINTNLENTYEKNKTNLIIAIMAFIQPILIIVIVYLLIMYAVWRRRRRG